MRLLPRPPARGSKRKTVTTSTPIAPLPSPQPADKPQSQHHIAPWLWKLFIGSFLVWLSVVILTLGRPILLPLYVANPTVLRSLPDFLRLPHDFWEMCLPLVGVLALCLSLRWIQPNNVSRLIVRGAIAVLAVRYMVWRTLVTLNFAHGVSATFSIVFYLSEMIWISSYLLYLAQTTWTKEEHRSREANVYMQDVVAGRYLPSVDVFVPTYKEPEYIVRRTVIGCQEMEYPNKTIYILDDTRRPHIRALAEELGCEYITRPDNTHAKAGNLNNALKQTSGELITIMDADFVPFRNFLTRTVGFFQNSGIDLVQTPQHYYNPDYHTRNLGVDHRLPNDMEHFFGHVQSGRDAGNSVICCGTSYVVRRNALEAIGGYYTRCCVEDYQTSIRLLTQGFRLIYLNEVLSTGESTRTFADFIDQRLRWLQGNLQVYFCGDELPIWSKLNWWQKSYHITLLLFSFNPLIRLITLTVPLLSLFLGSSPMVASVEEYLYYAIPFTLMYAAGFTWGTDYRLSGFWNEVYETIFCFPALQRIWLVLRNPFAKASTATRKGVKATRKNYNFHLTRPLVILVGLTIFGLCLHYGGYWLGIWPHEQYEYQGKGVLIFWVFYNLVIMLASILSGIDQPVRRVTDRFPLRTACKLTVGTHVYWGHTTDLSEQGANVTLTTDKFMFVTGNHPVTLEFLEHGFSVEAEVVRTSVKDQANVIALTFPDVNLEQNRSLISMLYCDMTWWKQRKKHSNLDMVLALLSSVLNPRPLLSRHSQ
jgi:cellulose synthase (UDP-forming)